MNIFRILRSFILLSIFTLFLTVAGFSQKTREEIADKYKWDLTRLFSSDEDWRNSLNEIKGRLDEVDKFRGTLTKSADNLLKALEYNTEISKVASKLSSYASMNSDLDTRNMKYSAMKQELQQLFSSFGAKSAFMDPEILSADWSTIEGFIKAEPKLEVYRKSLESMFRNKKHSLSEPEEKIMALSRLATGVAGSVYNTFSDAEMPSAEITLSSGDKVKLTSSEFSKVRASANKHDREVASKAYWANYAKFKATYGELLNGKVNGDVYRFRARHYNSSLEASLDPNNIPVEVYHSLIDNVNKSLPSFYRYLNIKKRIMGLDTLKYSDIYAPVVKDVNLKYTYDEATKLVLDALNPMGEEYVSTVKKAINERWIDVFPTAGKQRGAYSNGASYDGHPYILLNYNDFYNDVSTLAHELGHTMHSYFSNKTQPYPLARYETFVAEVASTFNEVLLFNYMIKTVKDDDVKLSILMNWLDNFKGTLFRQTQFAEFELKIHELAEQGKPLTGETFCKIYKEITDKYYGNTQGICKVDDYISMEWAAIPHFYRTFYVYQYSTSFTASISLAEKVMTGDKKALENYLKFLSSGGNDYPIEILKKAGVDMTTSEPFEKTTAAMNKVMDEIEQILDKKQKQK
ncbi:MAG TPA: oligoendopeptidase F [Prolixibacteraceae bacterium]|nr:oligoendopeptidase F [Prolixibacteraceae bacterium]HPR85594.1 oligoendopeptidase F [Prolixibacteraceae bacterium]